MEIDGREKEESLIKTDIANFKPASEQMRHKRIRWKHFYFWER